MMAIAMIVFLDVLVVPGIVMPVFIFSTQIMCACIPNMRLHLVFAMRVHKHMYAIVVLNSLILTST
jgi:hypothetical protein